MKCLTLLLVLATLASVISHQEDVAIEDSYEDSIEESSEESLDDDDLKSEDLRGVILSSVIKGVVKDMLKQMPCGWPEYGVPPLAPYRKEEVNVTGHKWFVDATAQMIHLRVDGLNKMKIKKLSASYVNKKVKFHFIFKRIQANSLFSTNTFADLLSNMGVSVRYEGNGNLDFSLHNIVIRGSFKFKLPVLFGSAKIYKFNAVVTVGDCTSHISGLTPCPKINRLINDQIENGVLSAINDNQNEISAAIEEAVVPAVNDQLKGKNIWDVIAMKPEPRPPCVPPPDPWA